MHPLQGARQARQTRSFGDKGVVNTRKAGWSEVTGTSNRTAFFTSEVTTSEFTEGVKAFIDDLTAHGLIGK